MRQKVLILQVVAQKMGKEEVVLSCKLSYKEGSLQVSLYPALSQKGKGRGPERRVFTSAFDELIARSVYKGKALFDDRLQDAFERENTID